MASKKISVLHLEDSQRDAQLIWDLLEEDGLDCTITHAPGRKEFEAALEDAEFDIILCDNNLNNYNGTQAIEYVRQCCPMTPLLIISGSIGEEEAVKGLQHGATDYLLKGRLERLGPAVRRALEEAEQRRQRQQAEDELRQNEERLRMALLATNDAIWDIDLERNRMVVNDTFRELFGDPPREGAREWWRGQTHADDLRRVWEGLERAMEAGDATWSDRHRVLRRDGQWAHVQNRACLARKAGQTVRMVGAVQDITTVIEAEKARQALEEQLRQAQKLEAIGTLAGGIAHDFNNILGIILTNAEVAQLSITDAEPDAGTAEECLDEILLASDRARDLVRQILTFSRRADVTRALLDPCPVVDECVRMLRSTIPAMVTLRAKVPANISPILANSTHLQQVVLNLCTNSWHALPERDGEIDVIVDELEFDTNMVDDGQVVPPGRYVRIRVADNGCGMTPQVKARIFEPFFTTKGIGQGTGLGLSVVHGIVTAHEGYIRVESAPGLGTQFELLFPARSGAKQEKEKDDGNVVRGRGQHILLLDDDKSMARATRRVLERNGYAVEVFHAPAAALEAIECDPDRCELIITDYSMPGMSGIEFARQVGTLHKELPIILLSGIAEAGVRARVREADNIKAVAEKPIWPAQLCRTVAEVLSLTEEVSHERTRILIVDDDRGHLDACVRMLKQERFITYSARDGNDALRVLAEHAVDLVLTDIIMPDKEGIELILTLRKRNPALRIIAMSGGGRMGATECLELSRRFGAHYTLSKPFSRDELLMAVHLTLSAKTAGA